MLEKNKIINEYLKGSSKSSIAKELGLSRPTIIKYIEEYKNFEKAIESAETLAEKEELLTLSTKKPKYRSENRQKPKMTLVLEEAILKCLKENEIKIKNGQSKLIMKRIDIHEYVKDQGFDISYRSVCAFVEKALKRPKESFIKQEYAPGYSVEFDWADVTLDIDELGGTHRLKIGVFTFKHSDYRYAVLCTNENTECFLDSHKRFFESVGGVPKEMVYDNAKVQVRRMTGTDKKPTKALSEISSYYGFDVRFTNYYRGNEKGNVERSVEVIRRKAFCTKQRFKNLAEAESALCEAVTKINGTTKQRTDKSADTAFAEEAKFLLPARLPMDVSSCLNAKVNKYSLVYVDTHFYSVPDWLSQKQVMVRKYPDKIRFYHDDKLLFETKRILKGKNQYRIDINHYLKTLKKKPGAITHSLALKQASPWLQETFHQYYGQNPRDFITLLELIKYNSLEDVQVAVKKLELRKLPVTSSYIQHELANVAAPVRAIKHVSNETHEQCINQLAAISSMYGLGGDAYEPVN